MISNRYVYILVRRLEIYDLLQRRLITGNIILPAKLIHTGTIAGKLDAAQRNCQPKPTEYVTYTTR
jgi:hypothetical protein